MSWDGDGKGHHADVVAQPMRWQKRRSRHGNGALRGAAPRGREEVTGPAICPAEGVPTASPAVTNAEGQPT